MTWRDLADLLGGEALRISKESKLDISKFLSASGSELLTLQAKTKRKVDDAIVSFCREGKWPALGEEESGMLAKRLLFAENIVRGFVMRRAKDGREFFPSGLAWSQSESVEFLLVDAWERYGLLAGNGN